MTQPDLEQLNNTQRYAQWATFRVIPGALGADRADIIAEAKSFFADLEAQGKVVLRGVYDISGIRAEADVMIWWHAEEFLDLQKAFNDFRRDTVFGRCLEVLSLIHISEPTRREWLSRMPSSA